jgi:hypothetical protein
LTKKIGSKRITGSSALSLGQQEIQQLTVQELTNLSQSQQVYVTIQLTKAVMAFENISEIPDFVGSGYQNKVGQESRPIDSISETASVILI